MNTRILLHKNESKRKMEIVFSNFLAKKEFDFNITNEGIEIISDDYQF